MGDGNIVFYYYCSLYYNTTVIRLISLGNLLFGGKIVLLKPLDRAERAIDTLGHYYKHTQRTDRPTAMLNNFKPWELPWEYIF